ncbi:MAG: hypothetical protein SFW09_08750 [Hyphomicrobiaceae bacterium]|nr:hypothetical protein [Hyphomicrobiaceae bacterium]
MAKLWGARLDLSEDDESFVEKLCERGAELALSEPQWKYVFALCRRLNLIDDLYISVH